MTPEAIEEKDQERDNHEKEHQNEPSDAEQPVQRRKLFSTWTRLKLAGEDYLKFGELIAWRATLWSGAQQVAEQKSFLWQ